MKKQDLKTGMTCQTAKGNRYMIYINPHDEITLIPIKNIYTRDQYRATMNLGLNITPDLVLKTDMDDDLKENQDFFTNINGLSPYQITKIYYPNDPLDLLLFNEEDKIWELNR